MNISESNKCEGEDGLAVRNQQQSPHPPSTREVLSFPLFSSGGREVVHVIAQFMQLELKLSFLA